MYLLEKEDRSKDMFNFNFKETYKKCFENAAEILHQCAIILQKNFIENFLYNPLDYHFLKYILNIDISEFKKNFKN